MDVDASATRSAGREGRPAESAGDSQVTGEVADLIGPWLDVVPAAVLLVNRELRCVAANQAAAAWTGLPTSAALLGRAYADLSRDGVTAADLAYLRAAMAGEPQQFQRTMLDPGGEVRHAQLSFVPYRSDGARVPVGVMVHMVNLTERVNTEAQLRRHAELRAGQRERALLSNRLDGEAVHPLFAATLDLSGLLQHSDPVVRRQATRATESIDGGLAALRAISRREPAEPDEAAGDGLQDLGSSYALTAEMVAANVTDLVTVRDHSGRFRWVSPSALAVTGWLPEQLLGQLHLALVHPDDQDAVRAALVPTSDEQTVRRVEYRYRRPDGTHRWMEETAQPLAADSLDEALIVTTRDITERRQLRAALAEATDTWERTFSAAPIGMALVGPDGRWLKVNAGLAAITGRTEEQLLAATFQDITHPEDLDLDLELLAQVVDGQRDGYQMTKRYLHRDGHVVWVQLNVACLRDADSTVRFFISQIVPMPEPS